MATTPNLGLSITSEADGDTLKFIDWRLTQDGTSGSSNMGKIDAWVGEASASIVALGASPTETFSATLIAPADLYGLRPQIPLLRTTGSITLTRIHLSCSSTSIDIDGKLKYADNTSSFSGSVLVDICDTTSGLVTIASGFDDATINENKYLYFEFTAEPDGDLDDVYLELQYTYD